MSTQAAMIAQATADHFGMPREQLTSRDRHKSVAFARQMAMYLIRQTLQLSYPEIGRLFGRDHTTVMHAVRIIPGAPRASAHMTAILDRLAKVAA